MLFLKTNVELSSLLLLSTALLVRHAQSERIARLQTQTTRVPVLGGIFETQAYEPNDNDTSQGVAIILLFYPNPSVGKDGDTISLVQTVRDTTKLTDPRNGSDITPQPLTSQLSNRTLSSADADVTSEEIGTGIDQEVLSQGQKVINLDPRYSEERMEETEPLNVEGRQRHDFFNARSPWSTKSAQKKTGVWSTASLNDEPSLNRKIYGVRLNVVKATVAGAMEFEVAALHNEQRRFLGSMKWGWRIDPNGHALLDPGKPTVASPDSASARFLKAAKKWNETPIEDPMTGEKHLPIQLPT